MFKKKVTLGAIAVVSAVMLAGCTNPGAGGGGGTGGTVDPKANLKGVSLTIWVPATAQKIADTVIKSFDKATGAIVSTVVIPTVYETNVPTKLQSGDKPDLMFWQPSKSTLPLIQPSTNLQVLDDQSWVSSLDPSFKSVGVLNGKRYAAVVGVPNVVGVYYNKKDFRDAGISKTPSNYSEMIADAKLIKQKLSDVSPFYEVGGDKWPLQFPVQAQMSSLPQSYWDALNKNQAKWTDPRVVAAIGDYDTNVIKGGLAQADFQTGTFAGQAEAVFNGSSAMTTNLSILIGQLEASHTASEIDRNIGWFPVGPTGNVALYSTTAENGVVAFKTGDQKKEAAARQFIAYWLGPFYQQFVKSLNVPSVIAKVPSPDTIPELQKVQIKALPTAVGQFQVLAVNAPDMYLYLADMLYGKKTAEQVAEATQAQFEQVAAAQGISGF